MLVVIDNYDSFTYNIVQYLRELGEDVHVFRNDEMTIKELTQQKPQRIIISPGPGNPDQAGISMDVIKYLGNDIPILGVCLGHQSLGQVFGGKIIQARCIMHGKTSPVYHNNQGIFKDLKQPLTVTRYHSLIVDWQTLPDCLIVTAWTQNTDQSRDEIMGLQHRTLPLYGVQFHPESILSEQGHQLFENFLNLS